MEFNFKGSTLVGPRGIIVGLAEPKELNTLRHWVMKTNIALTNLNLK
jgi:hypothetical protein